MRTIGQTIAFGITAAEYQALRRSHPAARAIDIKNYVDTQPPLSFDQFLCEGRGHRFAYSGTAYGGDDESFGGEGRCYCLYCGLDGDG